MTGPATTLSRDWDITPSTADRVRLAGRVDAIQGLLAARRIGRDSGPTWVDDPAGWRARVISVGGCARPIHLDGSWRVEHADTGDTLAQRSGLVFAPCGNRRAAVCPACADRYAHDTFHLVRAGLTGGKGVPETVSGQVRLFVTLTAQPFGTVHNRATTATGRIRRCPCGQVHHEHDPRIGTAVDPAGYDYVGAVLWNAHAPELWRRFTITCARHLAHALGVRSTELRSLLRVSYVKVGEYQRRGLVHFHAVVRIDGPAGPDTAPPSVVTAELVERAVRTAAADVRVDTPDSDTIGAYRLAFGPQVDVEPITAHDPHHPAQLAHDRQVAGYVAKYATKGTGITTGADHPIRSAEQITSLPISEHHKTMIATAWRLGGLPEFAGLRLRKWAHMLGFRGHFLTKSRRYSTTFGALRAARGLHRLNADLDALGITDTTDIVVINDWTLTDVGYRNDTERELAAAIAARTLERRQAAGGHERAELA